MQNNLIYYWTLVVDPRTTYDMKVGLTLSKTPSKTVCFSNE